MKLMRWNRLAKCLMALLIPFMGFTARAGSRYETYIHAGFLDHKTGFSLVGYAHSYRQTKTDDFFLGVGTAVSIITASAGWKHTFYDRNIQGYSVFAVHAVSSFGGIFMAPFASFGAEKNLFDDVYLNVGANATLRPGPNNGLSVVTFPNVNVSMRY